MKKFLNTPSYEMTVGQCFAFVGIVLGVSLFLEWVIASWDQLKYAAREIKLRLKSLLSRGEES